MTKQWNPLYWKPNIDRDTYYSYYYLTLFECFKTKWSVGRIDKKAMQENSERGICLTTF